MTSNRNRNGVSKGRLWTGRILSGILVLLLLLDALSKFVRPEAVVQGTLELGYPESTIVPLGVVLLGCTLLYAAPRTSILGAILLTGYLGGAVASHVRVGHPLLTHTLFPVFIGALLWTGLVLRNPRLEALLTSKELESA